LSQTLGQKKTALGFPERFWVNRVCWARRGRRLPLKRFFHIGVDAAHARVAEAAVIMAARHVDGRGFIEEVFHAEAEFGAC